MSWMTISLYTWEAIFFRGRFTAFVSKKEEDADFLVKRAKFIIDNLDPQKFPKELIPKYNEKYCHLEFPEINSKIQGFPQGADQLRQFTFSGIFGDESAFWENAEKFYGASFPTIDGGGRMTLVSSPAPGFFKKLCFDALGIAGDVNVSNYAPDYMKPMEGVRVWKNAKNRFLVYELHYTADPEKRHPEYRESIKNSMPVQEYLREYELHWDTFSGQRVFPDFGKIHIIDERPEPVPGVPMLIGIDWGLTPAAVIGQFADGVLTIFKEYQVVNMGAERFLDDVVIPDLMIRFPAFTNFKKQWLGFGDPAGQAKSQSDETTCFQIAGKYFNMSPGPIDFESRRKAVTDFLIKLKNGEACFQVYAKDCNMLVKGFEGGYRFDDKHVEIEPNKLRPIKDIYSHGHDSLQYLCAGVKSVSIAASRAIPTPTYFPGGLRHGQRVL